MAIFLKSSQFTDIYGNTTSDFKANAGDTITCVHTFESEIGCMSSDQNVINVIKLENKVTRTQGSFLEDGFRVGDTYYMEVVDNVNSLTATHTGTINEVYDLYMIVTGLPSVNNVSTASSGNIIYIHVNSSYDALDFGFNFIDNNNPNATLESFIDQETSRFGLSGISSMIVTDVLTPTQIGKKSGQFSISNLSFERLADISNPYSAFSTTRQQYKLTFDVVFTGLFNSDFFKGDNCLRYYLQAKFKRSATESLAPTKIELNESSNTGYYDEGYNNENPISTDDILITNLYYNKTNNVVVTFTINNTSISQVELGGCYISLDDTFNYNKPQAQDYFLPLLRTGLIGVADIGSDWNSSTTYPFNVLLNDFSYVDSGGNRTFTIDFDLDTFYTTANSFGKFIEGRGDLEREFKLWVKVGNVNKLIFNDSLAFEEPVGISFTPNADYIVNHDNNEDYTNLALTPASNSDFNVEDDLAQIVDFTLDLSNENQGVRASIVVYDGTDEFELENIYFDLTNQDFSFYTDMFVNVSNNLPSSSKKKQAFLIDTSSPTTTIDLRLFYPFLIKWEYWIEQLESHPYFSSKDLDNQQWINYIVGSWKVYLKTEIKHDGVFDYYYKELSFKNYDDWGGTSTIELWDETETTQYTTLKQGTKMLVKAIHAFPSAYSGYPYGMITIEKKESEPRYIISTEVDRTQNENPLIGISNQDRCDMEFFDATTIILRSYVDTNLLNGVNFCISSKISEEGTLNNFVETNKITEAGDDKLLENGTETKITE